jgi:hypothetical protein
MGTLAFFPWLRLNRTISLEGVELMPFRRGAEPGGTNAELQQIFDGVLEPYRTTIARPVDEATLVFLAGQGPTDSIGDDAVRDLFVLAELLAFSALAVRQFFNPLNLGYANRDVFHLVVQKFDDPRGGVSLTSRRRDGSMLTYVTHEAFRVDRPRHVSSLWPVEVDEAILRALVRIGATDDGRYFDSVVLFNRSNTDGDEVRPEVELILVAGALQRVLECRTANINELANNFLRVFVPSVELPLEAPTNSGPLKVRRRPWPRTIREAWIRDLYVLRGDLAHGRTTARYQADWSVAEHLLLAAYAFPRVVKLCLAEQGAYELTDQDRFDVDVFEDLARHELLRSSVQEGGEERWPWNTIRSEWVWSRAGERMRAALETRAEDRSESGEDS